MDASSINILPKTPAGIFKSEVFEMKFALPVAMFLALALILSGVGMAADKNVVAAPASDKNLSEFVDLIKTAGIADILNCTGPLQSLHRTMPLLMHQMWT